MTDLAKPCGDSWAPTDNTLSPGPDPLLATDTTMSAAPAPQTQAEQAAMQPKGEMPKVTEFL